MPSLPEYQPSARLAKWPKLGVSTDGSAATISNPPPSILHQAALEPLTSQLGFKPSSKLSTRPKLAKSVVASSSRIADPLASPHARPGLEPPLVQPPVQEGSVEAVPPPQFYGTFTLASPFGGYSQEGEDHHVRFKNPLVEGTPLE